MGLSLNAAFAQRRRVGRVCGLFGVLDGTLGMRLRPLRVTTILCSAAFDATTFDAMLQGMLQDARSVGPQADTYEASGPLYTPASCVLHVPEAQGSLP